ncbi:MAG: SCO family protein [Bacteroidota bacterium]
MRYITILLMGLGFGGLSWGCEQEPLPILGQKTPSGEAYTIPGFSFMNQNGQLITDQYFAGKIYVADFFFTSCPDICPRMSKQMKRLHDAFMEVDEVVMISHSLDARHDSVPVLKAYADGLGINADKWQLVTTPDPDYVYQTCFNYLLSAGPDESLAGGIFHSGKFVLVDKQKRIRGFYEGTEPDEVDKLMKDIKWLLNEPETAI